MLNHKSHSHFYLPPLATTIYKGQNSSSRDTSAPFLEEDMAKRVDQGGRTNMGTASSKSLSSRNLGKEVNITINGKSYKVSDDVPADTSLNTFIREHAQLKGTKFMCLEGGCGACIVGVTSAHPATGKIHTQAVNSCLVPIFACHGWSITTIEGLGSKKAGYNKVAKRLAAANGTQCGYCSPAMVMNMHCLLESNPKITMKEVENSFGGNICRCTGYRPIMDAFKSMASDAPTDLKNRLQDIEIDNAGLSYKKLKYFVLVIFTIVASILYDIVIFIQLTTVVTKIQYTDLMCEREKLPCSNGHCSNGICRLPEVSSDGLYLELKEGSSWFRPADRKEVYEVFDMIEDKSYRFIAGNTAQGVYRYKSEPQVFIDLNSIAELHKIEVTDDGITIGANVSLTEAMNFFYGVAKDMPKKFAYCKTLADHIDLIANVPVRNAGTLAGNIYMKHVNHEFPSDIFLTFEMVGAQLVIGDPSGTENQIGLLEFLQTGMNKKLILRFLLPPLDDEYYVTHSFKIMPRAQNAHAYVNAGFKFKLDSKTHKVLEKPTILFGGINPEFLHASKTEDYMIDKMLLNGTTLDGALAVLEGELQPDNVLPDASPEYRKGLALSLLYKFLLTIAPNEVNERYRSGGSLLERGVSSGKQDFETDPSLWPLNKPLPKIEGLLQCSGEAEYVNDIPHMHGQLWAQLVLSDRARAVVAKIDPSEALKMEGVVAFYSAEDIPGKNNFYGPKMTFAVTEVVFTEGRTNYAGEAVGVIVAESHALAMKAAKMVKVEYTDQLEPVISARQIIYNNMSERISNGPKNLEPQRQGKDVKLKISGRLDLQTQYHFMMEPLTCLTVPHENELDVYPTSQWPGALHEVLSEFLKVSQNNLNIKVRRVGGGYGAKISRIMHTACVASLCALQLQRPVRLVLGLETMMEWIGKRAPALADYEAGVDSNGVIQYLNMEMYEDGGFAGNESPLFYTIPHLCNCYDFSTWSVKTYSLKTDKAGNTWCRAPGSAEGVCMIENIMEHIANATGQSTVHVRMANMDKEDPHMSELIQEIQKISDYENRIKQIDDFNKLNRWKKRGISLVPMTFPIGFFGLFYAEVSVFAIDGTVAISHMGVEMGQGLNTKVVQVAAHVLGIDVWKISTKPVDINIAPNSGCTGGSTGSETVCFAVKMCCEELNKRLEPIKKELGEKATWEEICMKAYWSFIDLKAVYTHIPGTIKEYKVYGVTILEVEVDILTGQYQTLRADIIEDAGISLSPEIDVGQVEGSFMMGLGYYTSEEAVYESTTGRLLTNRTWNYKPPGAKDIPKDFRITLRKNAPNPVGVLRSKATGEPALCMSCAVLFSIRNALESARKDSGLKQEIWFDMEPPYTAERIWLNTLNKKEMYKL